MKIEKPQNAFAQTLKRAECATIRCLHAIHGELVSSCVCVSAAAVFFKWNVNNFSILIFKYGFISNYKTKDFLLSFRTVHT